MQVNFKGAADVTSVKLPPLRQVDEPTTPIVANKSNGFSTKEAWKDVLKFKANVDAYSGGFVNGIKNSLLAGAGLVGLDWLIYSSKRVGSGEITAGKMLATPFKALGKSIATCWKFIFGGNGSKSIFTRSLANTIKRIVKSPLDLYSVIRRSENLTSYSKYGLPIVVVGVAAYSTFRSYLNANKEKAEIDHAYGGKVGHH